MLRLHEAFECSLVCCMPLTAIVTWKSFRDGAQKVLNTVHLAASKKRKVWEGWNWFDQSMEQVLKSGRAKFNPHKA